MVVHIFIDIFTMRESKIFILLFSVNTHCKCPCPFIFFPIGLLVFFLLLICENSLYMKALALGPSPKLQIFVHVCYLPFDIGNCATNGFSVV